MFCSSSVFIWAKVLAVTISARINLKLTRIETVAYKASQSQYSMFPTTMSWGPWDYPPPPVHGPEMGSGQIGWMVVVGYTR